MRISSRFFLLTVLLGVSGCKTRSYNSSNDSVKDGVNPSADASRQNNQSGNGDPSCASSEKVVVDYQNGAQTETDYVRLKLQPKKWQGKDINGDICELMIESTAISSRHFQTMTFSAKFQDFNLPKVFRDVEAIYLGLANDVKNGEKVAATAASLGDNPGAVPDKYNLVNYSTLFGALSAGGLSPINKVIRVSISKKTCSPVFMTVHSSYPLERKANICVF